MKVQPIQQVTGIRIELTISEAVRLIRQGQAGKDRVVDAISGTLRASGVDPETGETYRSSAGLITQGSSSLTMALPSPSEPQAEAEEEDDEEEPRWKCPYCPATTKTERGLKVHIGRIH
jgi:hypothetical protein